MSSSFPSTPSGPASLSSKSLPDTPIGSLFELVVFEIIRDSDDGIRRESRGSNQGQGQTRGCGFVPAIQIRIALGKQQRPSRQQDRQEQGKGTPRRENEGRRCNSGRGRRGDHYRAIAPHFKLVFCEGVSNNSSTATAVEDSWLHATGTTGA